MIHENSIMSTININRLDEITAFEHWVEEFHKKKDETHYQQAMVKTMDSITHCYKILKKILDENQKQELINKFKNYQRKITIKLPLKVKIKHMIFTLSPNLYSYLRK